MHRYFRFVAAPPIAAGRRPVCGQMSSAVPTDDEMAAGGASLSVCASTRAVCDPPQLSPYDGNRGWGATPSSPPPNSDLIDAGGLTVG